MRLVVGVSFFVSGGWVPGDLLVCEGWVCCFCGRDLGVVLGVCMDSDLRLKGSCVPNRTHPSPHIGGISLSNMIYVAKPLFAANFTFYLDLIVKT